MMGVSSQTFSLYVCPIHPQYEILEDNTADPNGTTQQAVLTLEGHTSNVNSIGFQRDGRFLYSGSEDGTIKGNRLRLSIIY